MNFMGIFIIGLLVLFGTVANDDGRVSIVAREAFFNGKHFKFLFS
jgi:hypothetical protein